MTFVHPYRMPPQLKRPGGGISRPVTITEKHSNPGRGPPLPIVRISRPQGVSSCRGNGTRYLDDVIGSAHAIFLRGSSWGS
jgi:hypothetical protein